MKNLLTLIIFISFFVTSCVAFAKYEDLDGTTKNIFTIGGFPFPRAQIDQDTGTSINFFGSLAGGSNFSQFQAHFGTGDEDAEAGIPSALVFIKSGAVSGATISGDIDLFTGPCTAGDCATGPIDLLTGSTVGAGSSGEVTIDTGDATGTGQTGFVSITTGDATGDDTGDIGLTTGASASDDSGDINLLTGAAAVTRGSVNITSNDISLSADDDIIMTGDNLDLTGMTTIEVTGATFTGDILPTTDDTYNIGSLALGWTEIFVDTVTAPSPLTLRSINETSASATGLVTLTSGDNAGTGATGNVNIDTGDAASASNSGAIFVRTGPNTGSGGTGQIFMKTNDDTVGQTGAIFAGTGNTANDQSGPIDLLSGETSNAESGNVTLATGGVTAGANVTGLISLTTGNQTGTGDSGDITLTTGTSSAGSRGDIEFTGDQANFTGMNDINVTGATITGDIIPSADDTYNIGSLALGWTEIFVDTVTAPSPLLLRSADESAGTPTGLVTLKSGDNAGAGDSGNISIETGTSAGGSRGDILFSGDDADFTGMTTISGIDADDVGAANKNLSNLDSPTSINQDLIPNLDGVRALGTDTAAWLSLDVDLIEVGKNLDGSITLQSSGTTQGQLKGGLASAPSGATVNVNLRADSLTNLGVFTQDNGTANAVATGDVFIESGNKLAGTGDSGLINIQTGTSSGGTRGVVNISGDTINITGDLLPSADDTYNIGSLALGWTEIFVDTVTAPSPLTLQSADESAGTPTGIVTIKSGDNAGAGDSGNIVLTTGTSAGGVRGDITFSGVDADFTGMTSADFTGVTVSGLPVTGANTSLSNLIATSINQDLIPNLDGVRALGTDTAAWLSLDVDLIEVGKNLDGSITLQSSGTTQGQLKGGLASAPSGATVNVNLRADSLTNLGVFTQDNGTANAVATGDVFIESGNKLAGTGDSGLINIQTGTSSGGTRGDITIDGNSLIVASDILPDADDTRNIGSSSLGYTEIFVDTVTAPSPLTLKSINETSASATGLVTLSSGDNAGTGATGNVNIDTGDAVSGSASGGIFLRSGPNTGSGGTGQIFIKSSDDTVGQTGSIFLGTGNTANDQSGPIDLLTGETSNEQSGNLTLTTGGVTAGADATGLISLTSGNQSDTGDSGSVSLTTGTSSGGNSGAMLFTSGNATVGGSGAMVFATGSGGTGGNSGAFTVDTGTAQNGNGSGGISLNTGSATGNSGTVQVTTGTSTAGSGAIVFVTGEGGTGGNSGAFTVDTGIGANGNSSGGISLNTGAATVSAGATGNVQVVTGDAGTNFDSGDVTITTGAVDGTGVRGQVDIDAGLVTMTSALTTIKVVGDPCGDTTAFPEGAIFYNDTSDYYCFCNGAGADLKIADETVACF